jgi:hypothetical protein
MKRGKKWAREESERVGRVTATRLPQRSWKTGARGAFGH